LKLLPGNPKTAHCTGPIGFDVLPMGHSWLGGEKRNLPRGCHLRFALYG
jgi:hypothetical protein